MSIQTEKLMRLCDLVSSGQADESEIEELQTMMLESESARSMFMNWSALQVDLQNLIIARNARSIFDAQLASATPASQPSRWTGWLGVLAVTMLIALLAASLYTSRGSIVRVADNAEPELKLDATAIVNRVGNVSWARNGQVFKSGDILKSSSWIQIESGVAEIEFGQGAVVILEGPARFAAKSTSVGYLDYGKLASVVPPWAQGFRIDTSTIEVIDRGTQFVLEVTRDQRVNVGVTKGEVELRQQEDTNLVALNDRTMHRILAGKSMHSSGNKIVQTIFNEEWNSLSQELPHRPDQTEVEVVARYRRDFVSGVANEPRTEGNWRYYANTQFPVEEVDAYSNLLWDSRRALYDPNGDRGLQAGIKLGAANFSYRGGHPGNGAEKSHDDHDHYVVAAFKVPKAGHYRIESGWLVRAESREELVNQAVDLRCWVGSNRPVIEEICNYKGLLKFQGDLGDLIEGDWIYVAVGPRGVAHNDRFEWDFAIVRQIEGDTF